MSLPPGEALYHVQVRVGQRSAGRSSVAAAAYRAGVRLADERLGRVFDYRRKGAIVGSEIVAPAGAAAWTHDRASLWNRVEAAGRANEVVFREVEVSIPRDVPADAVRPLVADVIAPYLAAGAVADVSVHAPQAADGGENRHLHILLTTRVLSPDGTGFGVKNAALAALFESGGRYGGERGAALVRERERLAGVINDHLRRARSDRRVDHRSHAARGLSREPEPPMGERDAARWRRTGRPSARQRRIGAMRALRRTNNELHATEAAMVRMMNKPYAGAKVEVKESLLRDRLGPEADYARWRDAVHMIDVRHPTRTRVQCRDGSWVEIDQPAGRIRTWGAADGAAPGLAEDAARALGWGADTIHRLERTARVRGPARRLTPEEAQAQAARWKGWGHADVTVVGSGVWIGVGASRLHDQGDRVTVHGPVTDKTVSALLDKAQHDWNGRMEVFGSPEFCAAVWEAAQQRGIEIVNYTPPAAVRERCEAARVQAARTTAAVAAVGGKADLARAVRAYAAGDSEAPPTPELAAVIDALPPTDRAHLSRREPYQIIPDLSALQQRGAALLAESSPGERPQALAEHVLSVTASLVPAPLP